MKNFFTKKRILIMAAVLCVGVLGTGTTFAMLTNQTGTIKNYFTVATVETQIEEELDERPVVAETFIKKIPVIRNVGKSDCFIRARITVTPSDAGVKLYAGNWSGSVEQPEFSASKCIYDGTGSGAEFQSNQNWVYYNGYYYYSYPVAPKDATESLFDAVWLTDSADITIYQEAVLARGYQSGDTVEAVDAAVIEGLFAAVEKDMEEETVTND